ncbi:MAG: MerR family transcriptional regulator, partial [Christensenellaceae bacterium]|nr:MerR family transcriptional regulator [Christensenellaceae bacterium]
MKIKEVCEKTLLTERTVRFYMQKGLICPKSEWVNGRYYTDFSDEDVDILKSIALLRQMTFSIEEILKMINEPALISQIVNNKRAEAKNSFDEAKNAYELLDLIDTEGIDSMMALAKELKLAVKDRPLIKSEPPQEINESGMGDRCQSMPKGLKDRWNLGAFLFPVIWGLANHVYQALLCLIPVFGIFYAFYLGKNGNELAWRGRYWESAEVFKKTQRIWALVTAIAAAFQISLAAGVFILDSAAKKQHEADIDSLKNQLTLSEEFKSIAGGRTEWTDDMGISYADPQEYPEDTKSLDMAIEECINTTIYILSDPFYKEADKYYRVLASDSFDFDFYMDDESMTDAFTDEEAADSSFR